MQNRVIFARNMGLFIVVTQLTLVGVILLLVLIAEREADQSDLLDLARIVFPILGAYVVSIVSWFAQGLDVDSDATISRQARITLWFVAGAVTVLLYAGVIAFQFNPAISGSLLKNFYTVVELSFGGSLAVIAREFFGHKAAAEKPPAAPAAQEP